MNMRRCCILGVLTAGWLSGQPLLAGVAPGETATPYKFIVDRNVFGLVPIPPPAPPVDPQTLIPKPKISPNGIMRMAGQLQVIFKVANNRPGQPPKEDSHVMGEGDREDEIEVVKIDEAGATITFNNHGEVQQLPLVASAPAAAGPPPGPVPGPSGFTPPAGFPAPTIAPTAGAPMTIGTGGRFGRNRNNPGANNSSPTGAPGLGSSTAAPANNNGLGELSYEEKIISMEAQRAKWLDEGNPAAAIIPPTPLTAELKGEGNGAGGPPAPGAPMPGQ